jgi:hypothetical protein
MARTRYSALIRAFALLFLLGVGFDFGVHDLVVSDFAPLATGGSSTSLGVEHGGSGLHFAPDHCFCHAVSMGAVVPARTVGLAPTDTLVIALSPQVPSSDSTPLDRPPELTV